jgi:NAD(P)-dependent dehydrogenase (short-subunit alcohol dehydrogenase family)
MAPSGPVDVKGQVDYSALKDRNVIVTGGASGLGKSFVHMFAENGANIVIADLQDGPGKELEQELAGNAGKYVCPSDACPDQSLKNEKDQIYSRGRSFL